MVCFSKSESQCIAWSEAWSLNVPILINENNFHKIKGRTIKVDNAPYLNEYNGLKFKDMNEFITRFTRDDNNIDIQTKLSNFIVSSKGGTTKIIDHLNL